MVVEIIEPFWFSTDWLCYPANAEFFIQLFENLHIYHVLLVEAVHYVFLNYLKLNAILWWSLDVRWRTCAVKSPLKNPGTNQTHFVNPLSLLHRGLSASKWWLNPGFDRDNSPLCPGCPGGGEFQLAYVLTRKWRFPKTLWQEQSLTK